LHTSDDESDFDVDEVDDDDDDDMFGDLADSPKDLTKKVPTPPLPPPQLPMLQQQQQQQQPPPPPAPAPAPKRSKLCIDEILNLKTTTAITPKGDDDEPENLSIKTRIV
jgi:hypothetical protein